MLYDKRKDQPRFTITNERAQLGILCILLLLSLGVVAFTAANTLQAVKDFQRQYKGVKAGDVSTIRPWMTIHAISHICHVPEDYLDRSLNIASSGPQHQPTLYEVAKRKRQPVDKLITILQHAILIYRKAHPRSSSPPPKPRPGRRHLSLAEEADY